MSRISVQTHGIQTHKGKSEEINRRKAEKGIIMMYWFIFNAEGEIISKEFLTEHEAEEAMKNGNYDKDEIASFVDGITTNDN